MDGFILPLALGILAVKGIVTFMIVYVAARLAIRHERHIKRAAF